METGRNPHTADAGAESRRRLQAARLYALIDAQMPVDPWIQYARSLIQASVDIIQLRDKCLDDRRLLDRARCLRELTRGSPTLFIVNDRPDLAVLSEADGVHVGQDELTVHDVRLITGAGPLIGVSTHTLGQARQAVLAGATTLAWGRRIPAPPSGSAISRVPRCCGRSWPKSACRPSPSEGLTSIICPKSWPPAAGVWQSAEHCERGTRCGPWRG